jgi:hypothetical protein
MPWYNSDFSFAWNVFAHVLVAHGVIVAAFAFYSFCWWLFCQTFKLIDGIVNDYYYD